MYIIKTYLNLFSMKKILALFTLFTYLFASSTLVHSFCVQAHLDESLPGYWCCDEEKAGSEDCFDHCMWSFSDTVTPVYEFTKKSTYDTAFWLYSTVFEDILSLHTKNYYLTESVYDPPRQRNYVWITKKTE